MRSSRSSETSSLSTPGPGEPDGTPDTLPRREFLQKTAGGLFLSVLSARAMAGVTDEDVTLSSDSLSLSLRVPKGGPARLRSLRNPKTGFEWCSADTPFEPVLVGNGQPARGWVVEHAKTGQRRFEFGAHHAATAIAAQSVLRMVPGAPVVEVQTEFHNTGARPLEAVDACGVARIRLRDDIGPVKLHQAAEDGPSILEAVDKGEFLFAGVEWGSGACRFEEGPDGKWLSLDMHDAAGRPGMQRKALAHALMPGERFPAPRAFLGVVHGDRETAFLTTQHYLKRHVFREPVRHWPWVEYNFYNFWSAGARAQEIFLHEIDVAADLGVELFTHDASWYTGSAKDKDNWGLGIGNYTDDREKYPMGLAALSRRVHEKGMKFGLWVGPNIVDPRLVGSLFKEEWLSKIGGKVFVQEVWGTENAPLGVCLGCPDYVAYLKKTLADTVERFQVDMLRWDESGEDSGCCDRGDHGHQAGDGPYASVQGQREIFEYLLAKFPTLVIQRACGTDYAVARTACAFRGDLSGDLESIIAGRSDTFFPRSSYSHWIASAQAGGDNAKLDMAYRGRMASWFGFGMDKGESSRVSLYPKPMLAAARRNIPLYKRFRHLLNEDCYHLLPAGEAQQDSWQAVQFASYAGDEAVVLVFRNNSPQGTMRVPVRALQPSRNYEVTFANTGSRSLVRGMELLRDGLSPSLGQPDMSEVIFLRAT